MSQIIESLKGNDGKHQESGFEFPMGDQIIDQACFEEQYENRLETHQQTLLRCDQTHKLTFMKSCITLLNYLEGSVHTELAGRVLLFLSKALPLFDQSGLNRSSDRSQDFSRKELPKNVIENRKRICEKDIQRDNLITNGKPQDLEEGETLSDDESNDSAPKDDTTRVYERFWRVQELLYSPNQLLDKTNWSIFRTYVDTILYKFESLPATAQRQMRNSYMTEPKAFALQLEDVNMQRAFLIQILIVIQYLESATDMKPKNLVLDRNQSDWTSKVKSTISTLLQAMPNNKEGREFHGLVKQLLRREEMWSKWKNDRCPEPKKVAKDDEMVNMRGTYQKKRKISDELKSAKPYNMHVIGGPDMSRLWNIKHTEEFGQPDLMKYIDIKKEKQADKFKDPNYSFRVLRLLRKNAHFFEQTSATIQSLDLYLKTTTGRILHHNKN